jgi:hypothetical protein
MAHSMTTLERFSLITCYITACRSDRSSMGTLGKTTIPRFFVIGENHSRAQNSLATESPQPKKQRHL